MFLIVGLGNPGKEYDNTPHNIGFEVLDQFTDSFELQKKVFSEISKEMIAETKCILAKPTTFMNESGKALRKIVDFYKIEHENIIVIHDDSDIELGYIKIAKERNSAGHKGINSIIKHLGHNEFTRFRIGIRPSGEKKKAETFVLRKYDDPKVIEVYKKNIADSIHFFLESGAEQTRTNFHGKNLLLK